ncbi:hypothetical protein D7Z54_26505 [Salibacterium salarium]|uniref:VanZ like family protein n=1 Tax=Salibacterium salarium TaxID=284579 RepID=A0A3R9PZJ2_9BACI|nr:hypothetical protein [Salibacterium salarium]RSL30391.1 hypothetical protein D7Z54_26505 [Salibacterium salarium]
MGYRWSRSRRCTHPFLSINGASLVFIIGLYACNEWYLKKETSNAFIQGYFNDMLAGWFMIAFLQIMAAVSQYDRTYVIHTFWLQLTITGAAGLFWEFAAPLYVPDSVTDPIDLAAYLAGGVIYGFLQKSLRLL